MIKVMGLDLSLTATGLCEIISDSDQSRQDINQSIKNMLLLKSKHKGMARLLEMGDKILERLTDFRPDHIIIEGYSFGSRAGQAFSIGELGGVVKMLVYEARVPTLIVPPTCLKKFITGKGNSSKDVMMVKTLVKYGMEFTDNNLCDAYGLAQMGIAYMEGTNIKYEQEALEKITLLT